MNAYYLASVWDPVRNQLVVIRVNPIGRVISRRYKKLGYDMVDRWALVYASSLEEAKKKFEDGAVSVWLS